MTHTLDSILILCGSLLRTSDPAFADALWTATVCSLLMLAGCLAMAMLPWTDREIARVNTTARSLLSSFPSGSKTHRATLHG